MTLGVEFPTEFVWRVHAVAAKSDPFPVAVAAEAVEPTSAGMRELPCRGGGEGDSQK
jgi:hypothetical protein